MTRALVLVALLATLGAGPSATISVGGAFVRAETLSATDVAHWPHVGVSVVEHDGTTAEYSGVPLAVVLHDAGAPTGDAVKGAAARSYVAVTGTDGYVATYSLAELDTTERRCTPLLADQRNGAPLAAALGAFRLVAPCDHVQARWVRNVASLTVVTLPGPAPAM
ncbi:MAG: molybdopterin-dependent oxidoreductase [Vulcanimicrobiaceae bacterium]|jgi:hypothetical protein